MTFTTEQVTRLLKRNPFLKKLVKPAPPVRVLIVVRGGVVQEVITDHPDTLVCIKDWDNIKARSEPGERWAPRWWRCPNLRRGRAMDRAVRADL